MRLILFDIDGTILLTDGAGRRAIGRALMDITGTAGPIVTHRFDGKTDPQIVRELLELAGHPDAGNGARVREVCERYVSHLEAELANPAQATRLMAGILDLLTALAHAEADGRAIVGLLTGNIERGAALKLQSGGIDPKRFSVGAYGSDAAHRPDLPAIAQRRVAERFGHAIAGMDVVIVGDTPDDVRCGAPIGARTVAVATGSFDLAALAAAGATHVFSDLSDTALVLDALLT